MVINQKKDAHLSVFFVYWILKSFRVLDIKKNTHLSVLFLIIGLLQPMLHSMKSRVLMNVHHHLSQRMRMVFHRRR